MASIHRQCAIAAFCRIGIFNWSALLDAGHAEYDFTDVYLYIHRSEMDQTATALDSQAADIADCFGNLCCVDCGSYFAVTKYLPLLINEIIKMVNSVLKFYQSQDGSWLLKQINHYISQSTITTQLKHGINLAFSTLTSVTQMAITFLMSFILSFFYVIELKQMYSFSKLFLTSELFSWLFEDIYFFGNKFVNTFGVVLEAQFFIALCNTALTTICLLFMHMPQILALALMVFILSLVPVAGVIISLIPLSMVGYSVGGIRDVIYIIIMVIAIHALESYVLNPKFMSSRTELPIFYTFVVLLVSEKLFGTWGLIVGVPIFTFLLDIMGVKSIGSKKAVKKQSE